MVISVDLVLDSEASAFSEDAKAPSDRQAGSMFWMMRRCTSERVQVLVQSETALSELGLKSNRSIL